MLKLELFVRQTRRYHVSSIRHTFILINVTIATETCLSAQNQFFFFWSFFVGKNLLLHMVILEKVTDRGFLAFWPFENEWKFRKSVKLQQKIWNTDNATEKITKKSQEFNIDSRLWKKYSTIFNGIRPVKCENEKIEHWKSLPLKYCFAC